MSILRIKDENGNWQEVPALQGKSAYAYAVEAGYTGTEKEFAQSLAGGGSGGGGGSSGTGIGCLESTGDTTALVSKVPKPDS